MLSVLKIYKQPEKSVVFLQTHQYIQCSCTNCTNSLCLDTIFKDFDYHNGEQRYWD